MASSSLDTSSAMSTLHRRQPLVWLTTLALAALPASALPRAGGQPERQAQEGQVPQVAGELKAGAPITGAGMACGHAPTPFQPHDLAPAKGLRITLRPHGDTVTLQLFSQLGRLTPVMKPLRTGEGWETKAIPFAGLEGFTPSEATALLFVASGKPRTFQFEVAGIEWLR